MIHYHGTPLYPKTSLLEMGGKHFCISFYRRDNLQDVLNLAQSIMFDNGAFSSYTRGDSVNLSKYYLWLEEYLQPPHWAVIPDVIDGDVEEQKKLLSEWHFPDHLSAPVWHLGLDTDYLLYLCDNYSKVCLGSSGKYWKVGAKDWTERMNDVFNLLHQKRKHLPWLHGMRMLSQCDGIYPLASADSTNVARNFKSSKKNANEMATKIDSKQPRRKWCIQ